MPPHTREVEIDYTALSLSVPEKVRFRYRLEGADEDWHDVGNRREAYLHESETRSLSIPGRRVQQRRCMELRGRDARVLDSSRLLSNLRISRPLLRGGRRARLGGIPPAGSASAGEPPSAVRGAPRGAEPDRAGAPRHASSGIHQRLDAAARRAGSAARRLAGGTALNRVLELMGKVIEEGRNAVRGLRLPGESPDDLEAAFSRIAQELNVGERVRFRIIGEGQARPLRAPIRDEVYRIGREALVNAFRHSQAGVHRGRGGVLAQSSAYPRSRRRRGHRSGRARIGTGGPLGAPRDAREEREESAAASACGAARAPAPRSSSPSPRPSRSGRLNESRATDPRVERGRPPAPEGRASRPSSTARPT